MVVSSPIDVAVTVTITDGSGNLTVGLIGLTNLSTSATYPTSTSTIAFLTSSVATSSVPSATAVCYSDGSSPLTPQPTNGTFLDVDWGLEHRVLYVSYIHSPPQFKQLTYQSAPLG